MHSCASHQIELATEVEVGLRGESQEDISTQNSQKREEIADYAEASQFVTLNTKIENTRSNDRNGSRLQSAEFSRILLIKPSALGDVVHTLPVLEIGRAHV